MLIKENKKTTVIQEDEQNKNLLLKLMRSKAVKSVSLVYSFLPLNKTVLGQNETAIDFLFSKNETLTGESGDPSQTNNEIPKQSKLLEGISSHKQTSAACV